MMKKYYTVIALLIAAALLLPACGSITSSAPDCKSADVFCIGLVTDVGKISDKSFNESAWNGLQQAAKELGAKVEYIETTDAGDYEKNISFFGDAGYDVIVTAGFNLGAATTKLAPTYPNTRFIGVDQPQAEPAIPNLTGLVFHEDEAGFLVGALAAQMSKTKKIGAVCATDAAPAVWRFGEGYKAGAAYINPAVEVTVVYHSDVGFDQTFSDLEWGAANASTLITNGVDVVFGAGGKTGNGAVIAAADKGVYAIGVDSDQYFTLTEAKSMLLSSAMKLITPGVFDLIKMAKGDKFPGGNYYGSVQYAPFHNLDSKVPADVKTRMAAITSGLADGSIVTNVSAAKP
jgi:basic membrane protein A